MFTIHKYRVPIKDEFTVLMPENSKVLCVQLQDGQPFIWAKVDTESPAKHYPFYWFGTGHSMPSFLDKYIGTIQMDGGSLVFHLFGVK